MSTTVSGADRPDGSTAAATDAAPRVAASPGWRGAGLTLLCLGGSLVLTFPAMLLLSTVAPAFTMWVGRPLFYVLMALFCGGGGALWGARLARLAGVAPPHRRAWALGAALGYAVSAPLATYAASEAETFLLNEAQRNVQYPMHLAFAIIFAGVILLVVGLTTLALGVAARRGRRALGLAALGAGTAVGCFLAVDAAFDLGGWRVGAPGAEARATMLVVLAAALLTATAAAGAVVGRAVVGRAVVRRPSR
ncbi:MAG TPA: hypothetical protein VFJ74_15430 [Gemmatimonadaceae bacterium]|nr:hypothetical protein [Gemmatimonadaceae bacterium]